MFFALPSLLISFSHPSFPPSLYLPSSIPLTLPHSFTYFLISMRHSPLMNNLVRTIFSEFASTIAITIGVALAYIPVRSAGRGRRLLLCVVWCVLCDTSPFSFTTYPLLSFFSHFLSTLSVLKAFTICIKNAQTIFTVPGLRGHSSKDLRRE